MKPIAVLILISLFALILSAVEPSECLVIDRLRIVGPTSWALVAHNKCAERLEGRLGEIFITLHVYNSRGERIGVETAFLDALNGFEKLRHVYQFSESTKLQGVATSVRVDKIQ